VIGPRGPRQGLGPWLARFLARAGAEVVAVAGTSEATVAWALADLGAAGLRPTGYADAPAMLEAEDLDLVVVASPAETHDRFLTLVREAGIHALCEKPVVWGGPEPGRRAREHAEAYVAAGLHLGVNVQWPLTLEAYAALFPGILDAGPTSFSMRLSPDAAGPRMLPEAMPHALSLLAAVLPGDRARVECVSVTVLDPAHESVLVAFDWVVGPRRIAAEVRLVRGRTAPREAAYGFDGRVALRRVEPGYRLSLQAEGRSVPLPDPTPRLVTAFVSRICSGAAPAIDPAASPGVLLLEAIAAAYPDREAPRP
jgi:hypothetical protein